MRTWRSIVIGAVLGALLGAATSAFAPDLYEATAHVVVTSDADADVGTSPIVYAQVFSRIADHPAVLLETGSDVDLGGFGDGITVTVFPDAPIIELTGRARTAELASSRANTLAEALRDYSAGEDALSGYRVAVATAALPEGATARSAIVPSTTAGIVLGMFAGLVLSMASARRRRS